MKEVFLVDGCRSPIGRGHPEKGIFHTIRADELASQVLLKLVARTNLNPEIVDDFYLGCVGQHLEQGKNLGRLILILSQFPYSVPAITVNRLCASSFSATQMAADSIQSESNQIVLVGGVEHMGHVSMLAGLDYNPRLFENSDFQWSNMGLTAELLAQNYNVSRLEQDQYTVLTNARYFKALESGFFNKEMIEILVDGMNISTDEQPRESNIDNLSFLSTPFKKNGTVTAANSSGIGDGACVGLLCDHESLAKHNWDPLAKIVKTVNIGLEPERMGLGPIYAIQKLFEITGLSADDIDLFEINEAFAVQMIICRNELGLQDEKVNIHGGAVAMGHPLGMSGLRVISTLAHSLKARNERYGIASMCVGHGQGVAMLLENS